MPKPLLSGYFTNHLNSVRNVKEVQKSLEDTNMCMSQGSKQNVGSLNDINEDDSVFAYSTMTSDSNKTLEWIYYDHEKDDDETDLP